MVFCFSWSRPSRLLFPALGLFRFSPNVFPSNIDVEFVRTNYTRKRNVRTGHSHHGLNDNETSVLIALERLEMMMKTAQARSFFRARYRPGRSDKVEAGWKSEQETFVQGY